jgi:hypothetical protein
MPAQLASVVTPPRTVKADSAVLEANLRRLGTRLPADFVAFGRTFGRGTFRAGGFAFSIDSPFAASYPETCDLFHETLADERAGMGTEDLELGLYPEPGGLLPFGHIDRGWFTWRTQGPPSSWRVIYVWSYDHDAFHRFDVGFTEFLVGLLTHGLVLPGTEENWEADAPIEFESETA